MENSSRAKEETPRQHRQNGGRRFRVSEEPVVQARPPVEQSAAGDAAELNGASLDSDGDRLYLIARDPTSLFVYWDIDRPKLFARAGMPARPLHLRVLREDESAEATIAIDAAASHYCATVSAAEARYHCEIGWFDGDLWRRAVRSPSVVTPAAGMSEDFVAEFATLPFHLSFQRMIELLGVTESERPALTAAAAQLETKSAALGAAVSPVERAEIRALRSLRDEPAPPAPEVLERWKKIGERFATSSWGGANSAGSAPEKRDANRLDE